MGDREILDYYQDEDNNIIDLENEFVLDNQIYEKNDDNEHNTNDTFDSDSEASDTSNENNDDDEDDVNNKSAKNIDYNEEDNTH